MAVDASSKLKEKIVVLADELSELERKRDEIVRKRCAAEAAVVFGAIPNRAAAARCCQATLVTKRR
jgi:hypothetical protein